MSNLILVRHGQSFWNLQRRFTGWADIDLTEKGKLEAKEAGSLIKNLNIDLHAFYTSELKRAKNTLNIILEILDKKNIKIIKTNALNERHYGGLTSLNKDEIIEKYGHEKVQVWRRSFNTPPPPMDPDHPYKSKISSDVLSESLKDAYDRVIPFYNKNVEPLLSSKKNVLIVFHGNSCRSLLKKVFNISDEKISDLEIPTGNPLLIKFGKDLKIKSCKYLNIKRAKKIFF
jgi:2,3-bisphosphoglycerate-dependent phosphoglycerate mutase